MVPQQVETEGPVPKEGEVNSQEQEVRDEREDG